MRKLSLGLLARDYNIITGTWYQPGRRAQKPLTECYQTITGSWYQPGRRGQKPLTGFHQTTMTGSGYHQRLSLAQTITGSDYHQRSVAGSDYHWLRAAQTITNLRLSPTI